MSTDSGLAKYQTLVDSWINTHGGYWSEFEILSRLTEELGEVASALQRDKGLRPRKTATDLPGEVGDLLFTLIAFANSMGIDLDKEIRRVFEKYDMRDGKAWQESIQGEKK